MTKLRKIRLCNWALLISTPLILASSIQLEATGSRDVTLVWLHMAIGTIFMLLVFWHLALNLKWGNWFKKISRLKSPVTKILWWVTLILCISAIAALIHWSGTYTHSPIGGLHGKIGFVMIVIAIGHTLKRIKFFKKTHKQN